jgi:hypothetical protein
MGQRSLAPFIYEYPTQGKNNDNSKIFFKSSHLQKDHFFPKDSLIWAISFVVSA